MKLLEVLTTPVATHEEAEKVLANAVEMAARILWGDKLLLTGGVAACESFGASLAPGAVAPGELGDAVVAATKTMRQGESAGAPAPPAQRRARPRGKGGRGGGGLPAAAAARTKRGSKPPVVPDAQKATSA